MPKRSRGGYTARIKTRGPGFFEQYPAYANMYQAVPRTANTLALYGASLKTANDQQRAQRFQDKMYGQGMYMGGAGAYGGVNRFKKAQRWAGFARNMLSTGRSLMSGQGEYVTNSTIAGDSGFAESVPTFGTAEDEIGAIMITHKEYITDIYGNSSSGAFSNTAFTVNPGIERTFPWLSQLAANFEEYEFKQLIFTYRPLITSDTSSTNGQVGTIIMATNYNVGNPEFADKATMMQYGGAASAKTTDSLLHGVECDPTKLSGDVGKYVRTGPVLVGQDAKTYDIGKFQLAISGTPTNYANQPIGELWVSYSILCRKPKLFTGLGSAISTDLYCAKTGCTYGLPFGTDVLSGQQNSIGSVLTQAGQQFTITFPATFTGCVRMTLSFIHSNSSAANTGQYFNVSVSGNSCVLANDIPGGAGVGINNRTSNIIAGVITNVQTVMYVDVKLTTNYGGASNSVTFSLLGNALANMTIAQMQLYITEMNELGQVPGQQPVLVNTSGTAVLF